MHWVGQFVDDDVILDSNRCQDQLPIGTNCSVVVLTPPSVDLSDPYGYIVESQS